MVSKLVGVWHLEAYAFIDSVIEFEEDVPDPVGVERWLFGTFDVDTSDLTPQTGLELVVRADDRYSERMTVGDLRLLWYDSEGVQVESPGAVDGIVSVGKCLDRSFLHPSISPTWMHRTREHDRDSLRYDDGDTLICDSVRAVGDWLVRVISVVTDDCTLNRIVARYVRARG